MPIEAGAQAPDFTLPADNGETLSLSDFKGQKVVLYFYPKDDTPGCTTEAVDFSGLKEDFKAVDTVVIGMSKDTAAKHDKFIAKHDLKVRLVSDEAGDTLNAYGVWVEKNMYGRKYMGIERTTLLIDRDGTVAQVWPKVKVKGHADGVLDAAKALA